MSRATRRTPPRRDAGRPRGEPILEAVLARTLDELAAHGLERLSVERIARAAQVNKTSIYRRWPTREALVVAALERLHGDVIAQLADTGSLRGDLLLLAGAVAGLVAQPVGRGLARAALAGPVPSAVAELAAETLASQAEGALRAIVKRARARHELREGVQPRLLLATVVGGILHRALLERRPVSKAWLEALVDVVIEGVGPAVSIR